MNALILRSPAAAQPYLEALRQAGLAGEACAVTTTTWLADGMAQLRRAVAELADGSGIFAASHNGVEAFSEAMASATPPSGARWHIATAGEATRDALAAEAAKNPTLGRHVASVVAMMATANASLGASAAAYFASRHVPQVLVPRAAAGRNEIIDALAAHKLAYTAIDCYETRPAPIDDQLRRHLDALRAGEVELVVVMAPSAVSALAVALAPAALAQLRCRWLAIGETTRAALIAANVIADAVRAAPTPTPHGVAQAVANWR